MTSCGIEREKFYPGPGLQPGLLALRASALPLRYPEHVPIQGRIILSLMVIEAAATTPGCRLLPRSR